MYSTRNNLSVSLMLLVLVEYSVISLLLLTVSTGLVVFCLATVLEAFKLAMIYVMKRRQESTFFYFSLSTLGSVFFVYGLLCSAGHIAIIGLLLKCFFFPFPWWFLNIVEEAKKTWVPFFVVLQKIPYLFILQANPWGVSPLFLSVGVIICMAVLTLALTDSAVYGFFIQTGVSFMVIVLLSMMKYDCSLQILLLYFLYGVGLSFCFYISPTKSQILPLIFILFAGVPPFFTVFPKVSLATTGVMSFSHLVVLVIVMFVSLIQAFSTARLASNFFFEWRASTYNPKMPWVVIMGVLSAYIFFIFLCAF